MAGVMLDDLAALFAELEAGQGRMRETVAAMDRSLTVLERTTGELRQDVTRLGGRVDGLEPRIDGIEARWGLENGQGYELCCPNVCSSNLSLVSCRDSIADCRCRT